MKKPVIGFVGMTHLGLVSAVAAAEKGFDVICFDTDKELVASLVKGISPVSEPQLSELMIKNRRLLRFTPEDKDLRRCDVIYVAPDVQTDDSGQSDLKTIDVLLELAFQSSTHDSVLVVLSQVPPGFTRQKQRQGRQLFYQVETLIFGRAIERALYPERYIIGCSVPDCPLPSGLTIFLEAYECPILHMRYESAELAKISINMFLVSTITTTNTLAELCEEIGANWHEIAPALRLDKRIGQYSYLNPGLGVSGGNLERDLATLRNFGKKHGTEYSVIEAWIRNSERRKDWLWGILNKPEIKTIHKRVIAVLGLTYKENTCSIKNSPALYFIKKLSNYEIRAFDPGAPVGVTEENVIRTNSVFDTLIQADVLVVATAWPEFRDISVEQLQDQMRGKIVIDPYSLLDGKKLKSVGFHYYCLGLGVSPEVL
jgi:UDPglucose 6-dehydrogenase